MHNVFGKMVDGKLYIHSINNPIHKEDGTLLVSGDATLLLSYGYKKIIYTEPPFQEGYRAQCSWNETEHEYIQTWTLVEDEQIEEESTFEDRLEGVEGSVTELSATLAVNEETTNMLLECILEMSEILYA